MNVKKSLTAVLCFAALLVNAQKKIEGIVRNENAQAISGASVSLLYKADSSLVKITLTKSNGQFSFINVPGNLLIKLTATGYTDLYQTLDENTKNPELSITMKKFVKELQAVQVRSTRPLYQFLPDKTILNIDAAPSNAGTNMLEVISKIPDVYIDKDGNITLNGKPGVLVMLDGRETFLSGNDLANYLRNMPAAASDQVEIISNPSAKYDATAVGGILNIKSKKNLSQGLNGLLSTASGIYVFNDVDGKNKISPLHSTNVNWNYRKNSVNIFGNAGYDRSYYFENFRTTRYFYDPITSIPAGSYFSGSHVKTPGNTFQLRVGADITLNKSNILGFNSSTIYDASSTRGATNSFVANNVGKIEYLMRSTIRNPGGNGYNGNYNVNHKFTSANKKWELTSDASMLLGNSVAKTINETIFFDTLGHEVQAPLSRKQTARTKFTAFVLKSDVVMADWKKAKWEMGYKYTYISTISNPLFLRKVNFDFVVDNGRTNYFKYSENILATYLTMSRTIKKTTLLAGLRLEQATGKGYQRLNDSSFTRRWLSLFPSIFIQHKVSDSYQWVLNYSRKIRRPSAGNLNPFTYFTDSLYSNSGNPFIQPHFAHTIEQKNIFRNKYSLTLNYTRVDNIITMVVNHEPVNKLTRVRQQNFDQFQLLSISAVVPLKITPYWQLNLTATAATNRVKGKAFGQSVLERSSYLSFIVVNNFTISDTWSADANLNYATPQLSGLLIFSRPPTYGFGIRKSLKNNKGNISFSSTVPFFIPHFRFNADYANTVYNSEFSSMNQTWRLTLGLKFGKQTIAQQRNKKNATDEEQSRM